MKILISIVKSMYMNVGVCVFSDLWIWRKLYPSETNHSFLKTVHWTIHRFYQKICLMYGFLQLFHTDRLLPRDKFHWKYLLLRTDVMQQDQIWNLSEKLYERYNPHWFFIACHMRMFMMCTLKQVKQFCKHKLSVLPPHEMNG